MKLVENMDFTSMELRFADLDGVTFIRCTFRDVDLRHADLNSCTLTDCCFSGIKGDCISFKRSILTHCDFSHSLMPFANFTEAEMRKVRFDQTMLYQADFTGSKLKNVNFHDADIKCCVFTVWTAWAQNRIFSAPRAWLILLSERSYRPVRAGMACAEYERTNGLDITVWTGQPEIWAKTCIFGLLYICSKTDLVY